MRRVDRVRLEKRRRLLLTVGLAFTLGALTAGALIWRVDHLAALAAVANEAQPDAVPTARSVGPATPAPVATAGSNETSGDVVELLERRQLDVPVQGVSRSQLRDTFDERRAGGLRKHEALDIMASRGTPVRAVEDGRVAKLFTSIAGGLTIYVFDPGEMFSYYYAHLDRYAKGLHEGQQLRRGDVIGYVGSTGNAAEDAPHLHFAIFQLNAGRKWWQGTPINPYHVFR
ncbi:MAG TPA: M23 family metallopeptidase [Vicinamibacterales bacterium]|nr:M23 family metallopeptidase [Vicinamibacterales bacterium]